MRFILYLTPRLPATRTAPAARVETLKLYFKTPAGEAPQARAGGRALRR